MVGRSSPPQLSGSPVAAYQDPGEEMGENNRVSSPPPLTKILPGKRPQSQYDTPSAQPLAKRRRHSTPVFFLKEEPTSPEHPPQPSRYPGQLSYYLYLDFCYVSWLSKNFLAGNGVRVRVVVKVFFAWAACKGNVLLCCVCRVVWLIWGLDQPSHSIREGWPNAIAILEDSRRGCTCCSRFLLTLFTKLSESVISCIHCCQWCSLCFLVWTWKQWLGLPLFCLLPMWTSIDGCPEGAACWNMFPWVSMVRFFGAARSRVCIFSCTLLTSCPESCACAGKVLGFIFEGASCLV